MNQHDLNMAIARGLKDINQASGNFIAGVLSDDISKEDQITFALRLVDLAIAIKQRANKTVGMVIEGSVTDDSDHRQTPG